jgi:hypothetical protein
VLREEIGDLKEFPGVPPQPEELREDEAGNLPSVHVVEHPLGLGVLQDRLSGDGFEVVDLAHLPALHLGIHPGARLVVLGALALGLLRSRDPEPDADRFLGLALGRCGVKRILLPGDVDGRTGTAFVGHGPPRFLGFTRLAMRSAMARAREALAFSSGTSYSTFTR